VLQQSVLLVLTSMPNQVMLSYCLQDGHHPGWRSSHCSSTLCGTRRAAAAPPATHTQVRHHLMIQQPPLLCAERARESSAPATHADWIAVQLLGYLQPTCWVPPLLLLLP
jgi:hypothetical protein